jgi:hypothetical protein
MIRKSFAYLREKSLKKPNKLLHDLGEKKVAFD